MAQWLQMFTGNTHGSLVRDRTELLLCSIEAWNATDSDNRTLAMQKKLLRLANNLLAATLKEKRAYLDRTMLDQPSDSFKQRAQEIEQIRCAGADFLLLKMGTRDWKHDTIDEQIKD